MDKDCGFALIYIDPGDKNLSTAHFESREKLYDFLLQNELEVDTCIVLRGKPELMTLRYSFDLDPSDYNY